jgi:dihydroflavonol-4-reductase
MRVLVTGGTGFIGAHSVKALVDAGHDVRLLVRNSDRIVRNLRPLGVDVSDYVVGDMCDEDAVGRALDGCDAVLHCAAVVALERKRAAEVLRANPRGAEVVIGRAVERGIDPIVHVSSAAALFVPGLEVIRADLPPTDAKDAYSRSKATAETFVRRLQADGAPISITYPGGVIGPAAGDAFGEMADGLVQQFQIGMMLTSDAAWSVIDVRDVGKIHAALVEPGRGPRRFMCGGHFMTMEQTAAVYRTLTGRRFPVVGVPGATLRGFGRFMDVVTRMVPIDSVFSAESMTIYTRWAPTDDRAMTEELGVTLRDPKETFADALRALHAADRLSRRQIGDLALGFAP